MAQTTLEAKPSLKVEVNLPGWLLRAVSILVAGCAVHGMAQIIVCVLAPLKCRLRITASARFGKANALTDARRSRADYRKRGADSGRIRNRGGGAGTVVAR
jgi:hypothetical protein